MSDKYKVMVYGSLKKGFYNHDFFLKNHKFIGFCETLPQYTLVDLGAYPGVVRDGEDQVFGELYEVDKAGLRALDGLEGHPAFYERELIETSEGEAWVYLLPDEYKEFPRIKDGMWKENY